MTSGSEGSHSNMLPPSEGSEKVRGQLSVISGWSQAGFIGIDDISGVGLRVVGWEGPGGGQGMVVEGLGVMVGGWLI